MITTAIFSWRVGALCNGQIYWTNYHCFRGCEETDGGGTGFGFGAATEGYTATAAPAPEQVYPNPANDELNIMLSPETKADCMKIADLQGKVVFEQRTPEQHLKIDSAKFIAGMYAVRVIYPDGSQTVECIVVTH